MDTLAELSGTKSHKCIKLKKHAFTTKKAKPGKRSTDYTHKRKVMYKRRALAWKRTLADMALADMGESEHASCDASHDQA